MRLALLTGVGRQGQVGETVAARLASDGFRLALVDRTPDGVEARASELRSRGRDATDYPCDLSDPMAVDDLFTRLSRAHGDAISACVHMAGGFAATGPVADTAVDQWERQLTINLRTAFLIARSA